MFIELRSVLLFFVLFILTACNSTPSYMYREIEQWPKKGEKFTECTDISEKYHEYFSESLGGTNPGIRAFHFPIEDVKLGDNSVSTREIGIKFDHNQTIIIDYEINGRVVSNKRFDKAHYICTDEGL